VFQPLFNGLFEFSGEIEMGRIARQLSPIHFDSPQAGKRVRSFFGC
jgi:hypothetical protein